MCAPKWKRRTSATSVRGQSGALNVPVIVEDIAAVMGLTLTAATISPSTED